MTIKIDVLGFEYDSSEPAFTLLKGGRFYYHIKTGIICSKDSVDKKLSAAGRSFQDGELGVPSVEWQSTHRNIISETGTTVPPPEPEPLPEPEPEPDND